MFSVPNLITLANLLCGCLAIAYSFQGELVMSAYLVGIAAVLDFLDGFAARMLKQYSPIGKELDSLADMVTFGVVPGMVMFHLLRISFSTHEGGILEQGQFSSDWFAFPAAFIGFLITLFSALRLAKFNVDTRQSDSFIGVPTPANSILICSLPLILNSVFTGGNLPDSVVNGWNALSLKGGILGEFANMTPVASASASGFELMAGQLILNPVFLLALSVVMSWLLIAEIPLFSLKVKSFGWKGNEIRFIFLGLSAASLAILQFIAFPLIILLYVLLSIVNNNIRIQKG